MATPLDRFSFRFRRLFVALCFLVLCGCSRAASPAAPASTQAAPPTALDEYVTREEPHYKWEKIGEEDNAQNRVTVLKLTSQTWQGRDWTHRVEVIRPQKIEFPDTALVLISYGSPAELLAAQLLARQTGATVINVNNVPNQPLFGKNEDALIAYTFQKYLETGDTTWPLLLPMTKWVVAAMDAAQEYSRQSLDQPITKFVVGGASKRGWTSWLVAAADARLHPNRVIGIVPLVYNNLNIPAQLPHQLESWGEYSPMIGDYTKLGLQDQTSTHGGKQLLAIVDPYSYRERFTMPKLLINGTNDPYWTPDATQFYLKDLPGSTSLYWAPNAGHDLGNDYPNVLSTAAAWFRQLQDPPLTEYRGGLRFVGMFPLKTADVERTFEIQTAADVQSVNLYVARSENRDFRSATWEPTYVKETFPIEAVKRFIATLPFGENKLPYVAVFAVARYPGNLQLCSPIFILDANQR